MVCKRFCFTTPCTRSRSEAFPIGRRSHSGSRSVGAMALYLLIPAAELIRL